MEDYYLKFNSITNKFLEEHKFEYKRRINDAEDSVKKNVHQEILNEAHDKKLKIQYKIGTLQYFMIEFENFCSRNKSKAQDRSKVFNEKYETLEPIKKEIFWELYTIFQGLNLFTDWCYAKVRKESEIRNRINKGMKVSEYTLQFLAKAVCGDASYTPYLKGFELVAFFNKYGSNKVYSTGFPSRWKYTEDSLRELNGTDAMRMIIEDTVDPRKYTPSLPVENAVTQINDLLKFDNYELKKVGNFYKLTDMTGTLVQPATANSFDHNFINQQIEKCQNKILINDFNGAITNARSLLEAIFIEIIERNEGKEIKNEGNVEALWSKVKKIMKLEIDKETMPDYVFHILSGIDTAIKGLAGLSNNAGDRHANKFNTKKHHAKLAVNLAMTISDFLLDSWSYQKERRI